MSSHNIKTQLEGPIGDEFAGMKGTGGEFRFGWGTTDPSSGYAAGALWVNLTDNILKINTGTAASPTWTYVGDQAA